MSFGSLARRLTAWYVVVAIGLVVLLAGAVTAASLVLYSKDVNEQIDSVARQIPDIELRARADKDDWRAGEQLLIHRLARPGLSVRVLPPPPQSGPPHGGPPLDRASGRRFGFIAATFLGVRPIRRPYLGGVAVVFADLERVQAVVGVSFGALAAMGLVAGLIAWVIGRYITSEAMRPLYDVTAALVRFAGRDFNAPSIDRVGRTEFDELVLAYNAAAAQVRTAFDERAAAEAQMRQFVADAGHELRTPLTIVLGYIDILKRRSSDDERSRRIFETIAIEGTRMRTLIDNLVLLARLEGEDVRPIEPFELTPLLEQDIVETRRAIAPQVIFDVRIGVDATVIGNRPEIYEAIANVVDNAIKYAPGSPVTLAVEAAPGGVSIAIADRGPGIPAADRTAIFERFYRGSSRGEVEGSGLGLPIAKRALERAGGTLSLGQTSAGGAEFILRLRADRVTARPASTGASI